MMFNVLHKRWKIIVRSDKAHDARHKDCHAIAILEDRKIHIRRSSLNMETVLHEMIHAYQFELSYAELQLDDDQIEEWFAELFCKYGQQMIADARAVLNRYRNR